MKNVSPERVEKPVSTATRKDTPIVNALKKAVDFQCQFPDYGQQIIKKNGGFYVEVAHIKPVSKNGQSISGNKFYEIKLTSCSNMDCSDFSLILHA